MIDPESVRLAVVGIVLTVGAIDLGLAFIQRGTSEAGRERDD